jgi:gamma-glutamyl-gamma-aminobutyraldehyde dehydrogenase
MEENMSEQSIDWHRKAERLKPWNQAFIDGRFVASASGATFPSTDPATGRELADVARCGAEDVDHAVDAARAAFDREQWSHWAPSDRKQVLQRLAALILEYHEEMALLETLCMGKPIHESYELDIPGASAILSWYAEAADKLYDEIAPTGSQTLATITREPVGVVGVVVPWNFPLDIAIWKIAPALMAGNSVVLKPAEQSPLSVLLLAELTQQAGLPDGVLNVVPGYGPEVGEPLGRHMDVDCLAFTGSNEVGGQFLRYAGESNLKMVWLECGGKSPFLVFSDCADLDRAADYACQGIFANQGEICSASSRLLVESSIHDEFVERVVARARALEPGDPLDPGTRLGAIVESRQTERILEYLDIGRQEGAHVAAGGESLTLGSSANFIRPTVFTGVSNDMRVAREEIFGPVLSVIPFADEADGIRIANDSLYGLVAALWTDDLSRAHRVSRALRAGTVSVNTVDAISPLTPFGGFKQSGYGRDLSLHAIDKYTHLKTTWIEMGG